MVENISVLFSYLYFYLGLSAGEKSFITRGCVLYTELAFPTSSWLSRLSMLWMLYLSSYSRCIVSSDWFFNGADEIQSCLLRSSNKAGVIFEVLLLPLRLINAFNRSTEDCD